MSRSDTTDCAMARYEAGKNSVWGRARTKVVCNVFFFQAEDGIRDLTVTGVQTCALPILMGEDPRSVLRRHFSRIAHVQIADVPGRHQPGTGKQPISAFLSELDELGYAGSVGLEYRPQGPTDESLSWLPRDRRA